MVLSNTIWITILFILGISLLVMILNRRMRDRCLKDFDGFLSTMFDKSGKRLWGRLKVYTTGLEFAYRDEHIDEEGHIETSSILYKQEFEKLFMVIRFHDELSEKNQARRISQLNKSFHPKLHRRLARSTRNLMVNLKDALTDITSAVVSSISSSTPAAKAFTGQQRQLTRAQNELVGYAGTAYDPILERHIGSQVVIEITNPSNVVEEHVGVLKEYSADFLEVMGVKYRDKDTIRECDIVVPRSHSVIRHSNEPIK
ncbi:hypothetical protein ACFLXY_00215 [Chloroflexota bacterium]